MRLSILESGHRLPQRALLRFILTVKGYVPDIVRVLAYRPDYFGRRFLRTVRDAMRGESSWSIGDRELMAAYTSSKNKCQYCVGAHTTTAYLATGRPEVIDAALADPSTAPISDQLRAVLAFLQKLTQAPSEVVAEDLEPLSAVGLSAETISDAAYVCVLFCTINRMADTFDLALENEKQLRDHAKFLLTMNYRRVL